MQATITYNGICDGGNHVFLTVTIGGKSRSMTVLKNDILTDTGYEVLNEDQAVLRELRKYLKRQGITTWSAARSAFNNLPLEI